MRKTDYACLLIGIVCGLVAGICHVDAVLNRRQVQRIEEPQAVILSTVEAKEPEVIVQYVTVPLEVSRDTSIPVEVEAAAEYCGALYGISPELLEAVAFYESSYNPKAKNGPCKGLMQVKETTHADRMERLGCSDIWNTTENMLVATDYLAELFDRYEDVGVVLMLYNGDSKAFSGELSGYALRVLNMAEELEAKHGKI